MCVCVCADTQVDSNPVLRNITDHLIEEVSAEEEELAGAAGSNAEDAADGKDSSDVTVETDEKLLKVGGAPARRVRVWAEPLRGVCLCSGAGSAPALPASGPFCGLLQLL